MPDIRLATAADASTIAAFNKAMARETEHRQLSDTVANAGVQALFEHPQFGFYVVAQVDQALVGSLLITYEWTDWRNGLFWWLQSVYVRPEFRRQGVFRKLMQFVEQQATRDPQFRGFRLYVERDNLLAQQTYRELGLVETDYRLFEKIAGHNP